MITRTTRIGLRTKQSAWNQHRFPRLLFVVRAESIHCGSRLDWRTLCAVIAAENTKHVRRGGTRDGRRVRECNRPSDFRRPAAPFAGASAGRVPRPRRSVPSPDGRRWPAAQRPRTKAAAATRTPRPRPPRNGPRVRPGPRNALARPSGRGPAAHARRGPATSARIRPSRPGPGGPSSAPCSPSARLRICRRPPPMRCRRRVGRPGRRPPPMRRRRRVGRPGRSTAPASSSRRDGALDGTTGRRLGVLTGAAGWVRVLLPRMVGGANEFFFFLKWCPLQGKR